MDIRWYGNTMLEIKYKGGSALLNASQKTEKKPGVLAFTSAMELEKYKELFDESIRRVNAPGEYEINELFIYGVQSGNDPHEQLIFKFEHNGLHVLYLPQDIVKLTEKQLDQIGKVDILIFSLPTEKSFLKDIKDFIEEIDPRVIIPLSISQETEGHGEEFFKLMSKPVPTVQESFDANKYTFDPEKTDIILIHANH